jgi:glycosyltransferase involved in cell wall biosynthesis
MPLFSVIIPVYNRAHLVELAIGSVLRQTCQDFELIVVDDGSSDDSAEVVRRLAPQAMVLTIQNSGPAVARNHGIQAARGRFVAFLDSDDVWYDDALANFQTAIEGSPEAVFIAGKLVNMDREPTVEEVTVKKRLLKVGRHENFSAAPINILTDFGLTSVAARRETLLAVSGFSPWKSNYEDMDLWLRLADKGAFVYLDEPVLVVRILHGGNASLDVAKSTLGLANILHSWQQGRYHSDTARQVAILADSGLRNLLGHISMVEWWRLWRQSLGVFRRAERVSSIIKFAIKGFGIVPSGVSRRG